MTPEKLDHYSYSIKSNWDEVPELKDYHPPDGEQPSYALSGELKTDQAGDYIQLIPVNGGPWDSSQVMIFKDAKFREIPGLSNKLKSDKLNFVKDGYTLKRCLITRMDNHMGTDMLEELVWLNNNDNSVHYSYWIWRGY